MTAQNNIKRGGKKRTTEQEIRRRTLISFSVFFMCLTIGGVLFFNLYHEPQSADNVQPTLRKGLQANEKILSLFFSTKRQAKSFKKSDAVTNVRVNGDVLTLNDIKALPKTEIVFDFKCVEGWSQVTWWGGVRFSDFMKAYGLVPQMGMNYVGMITPDQAYYVGNDMPSMLQPQTILCYEMNGKPLPQDQGYPLRLIIPVKYGIKHLKRIGVMYFSNTKPKDYWAEQGYDYFAGL